MREKHREPEVPEAGARVVECLDGLARITLEELAITHFVKNGTLQFACSTRPRVVAGLGKSARMHTVRLMNSLIKGPKRMMTRVQVAMLKKIGMKTYGNLLSTMHATGHGRSGRPDKKRDHELKRRSSKHRSSDARQLGCVFQGHEAAEVYSPEELRHAETNPMRKIHEGYCASH